MCWRAQATRPPSASMFCGVWGGGGRGASVATFATGQYPGGMAKPVHVAAIVVIVATHTVAVTPIIVAPRVGTPSIGYTPSLN